MLASNNIIDEQKRLLDKYYPKQRALERQTLTLYNENRIRARQNRALPQVIMIIHFIQKFKQMCYLLKVKVAFETTFTSLAMIYEKLFPWEV